MREPLRVGFIGCGAFATAILWPCIRYAPIAPIYACATRAERAEHTRRRFGAERATTHVQDVLDDESADAVFVVGPPPMHYEIGLRVLAAGKHLFIEKPPGLTLEHALELEQTAARYGVQCQVGFQKRFAPAYLLARRATHEPAFGGVRLCKVNYSHWRERDWATHLAGMSIHALDLVRYLMGDPTEAHVLKRSAADRRETCVLTRQYGSGAIAVVNISANDPHVQEWVELSGANQLISVRDLLEVRQWTESSEPAGSLQLSGYATTTWRPQFAIPVEHSDSLHLQGYAGEVVAFAEAILDKRAVAPSVADGVVAMRYVDAIMDAPDGMSQLALA